MKNILPFIIFASVNLFSFYKLDTLIDDLNYPWGMTFISENTLLITELPGKIKRINLKTYEVTEIKNVKKVLFRGQGGLSGITLHPQYEENGWIYISYSASNETGENTLFVDRIKIENDYVSKQENIFKASALRTPPVHFGAKMAFLKDNSLLITSGDGFDYRESAQKLDNHFGKIIRIKDNGDIPSDNPFFYTLGLKDIFSYGHRNMQGLVVLSDGTIVEHEHGPRGGDEINFIRPGKNYGWPAITYGIDYSGALISPFKKMEGMEQPIHYWTPSIAPSGMMFYEGDKFPLWKNSFFISALVPGDVRRIKISKDNEITEEILFSELNARIRNIIESPKGEIYLITDKSNAKLIKVSPN
ncbi:MAG: PQQ-dependent sugar dehydrogenase [Gammaproteobacteria bacterium]